MTADQKPKLEIADIFNRFSHQLGVLPPDVWKVVRAIKNCRTSILGGHRYKCNQCDFEKTAYNSCRNRHCPKCQNTATTKWIDAREEDLLPCQYYHVVFTIPANLRHVFLINKKPCYTALFDAASQTIKEVCKDQKHLGGEAGFIGVLHTWSQNLIDHPHVHFIVPRGGLSEDKKRWIEGKKNFFVSVKVLSKVFRGKLIANLRKLYTSNKLQFTGVSDYLAFPQNFDSLLTDCSNKNFVVYAKKSFQGPKQVINYLGQYTHRIAISNHRLIKVENDRVYFRIRDPKIKGQHKSTNLQVKEFMRRYLLHVLPKRFVRIRHYGFLSSRFKKQKLEIIRKILNVVNHAVRIKKTWKELLKAKTGIDVDQCPKCRLGRLSEVWFFTPLLNSS